MSTPFQKQVYTRASADHRDFDGFLDEMERALRAMGIYCVNDPDTNGSDMNGVIFHQGPIDPRKLWAWLRKQNPENYLGSRLTKEVIKSLTPMALYEKGDLVEFRVDRVHHRDPAYFTITKLTYSVTKGWLYTLDHGRPFRDVEERLLVIRAHARQD
jgi:hypothetical protein